MTKTVQFNNMNMYVNVTANESLLSNDQKNYLRLLESYIIFPQLPLIVAFWSRLAEIAVRISFVALTWTATLLFENLGEQLETLLKNDNSDPDDEETIVGKMEEWMRQYDLTRQFVEEMNRCFGIILIIVTAGDFASTIMQASEILEYLNLKRTYALKIYDQDEGWSICDLSHTVFRNLLMLASAYRVHSSVTTFPNLF